MALITIPFTFSAGAVIVASQHNSNFTTISSDYNGNIDNSNIAPGAGILYSKLTLTGGIVNADFNASAGIVDTRLATVSTAGKVSGAALTSLSSIPAGAGVIPTANLPASPAYATVAGAYVAGSYLTYGPGPIFTGTNSATPQKIFEILLPRSGTITVVFGAVAGSGNNVARIYKNGSTLGTSRTVTTSWVEWSENLAYTAGDLLQVYVNGDTSGVGATSGGVRLYENVPVKEESKPSSYAQNTVWNGPGVPDAALGTQGDLYLRTDGSTTTTLYVKTGASTWTGK